MLKAGKEDLDSTLQQVEALLQAKKAVLDKEIDRQTAAAIVNVRLCDTA